MVGETATELEAMRKDDRSWHPCRISLRPSTNSTNSIIIVDFCDLSGEEIISSEEEALKHLRYSSTFLRDGKCASIDEGECVLAMNKLHSQSLFFDAVVEKMLRVRHSKRVYCRCTFEVKWIHSKWNWDVMILSSGAIKKLSKKSIKNHPVIVEFLNSLTSATSFSEEIKGEAAIQGLVESQIEKISTVPEEVKGPDEARVAVTKVLSEIFPFDSHNEFEGYNKVQKTLQFGEVDKNLEDRPFLSPLAARAALASLVHDLPRKSEIFVCHTGEGFSQIPFINSVKHIDFPSSNRSSFTDSKVLMHRSLTAVQEFSQKTWNDQICEAKYEYGADIINNKEGNQHTNKDSSDVLTKETSSNIGTKFYNKRFDNRKLPAGSAAIMASKDSSSTRRQTRSMSKNVNQKLSDVNENSGKNDKAVADRRPQASIKQKQSIHSISENMQLTEVNNLSPELELADFKQGIGTREYLGRKKEVTSLTTDRDNCSVPQTKKRQRLSGSAISFEDEQGKISTGCKVSVEKKATPSRTKTQFSHRPRTRSQR